jgi:hypothetical protein
MSEQYTKAGVHPDKHKLFGTLTVMVYATQVLDKHKDDPIQK